MVRKKVRVPGRVKTAFPTLPIRVSLNTIDHGDLKIRHFTISIADCVGKGFCACFLFQMLVFI
jgi:hypothetical protein